MQLPLLHSYHVSSTKMQQFFMAVMPLRCYENVMFKQFKKWNCSLGLQAVLFLIGLVGYAFGTEVQDELRAELCRRPRTDLLPPSREGNLWSSNVWGKPFSRSLRSHHAGRVPRPNVRILPTMQMKHTRRRHWTDSVHFLERGGSNKTEPPLLREERKREGFKG